MTPRRLLPWAGQAGLYGLFALFIGVFSGWPAWRPLADDQALIKVSFIHYGQRVAECRAQTAAELARLPPNMRAPMKCERERAPITIEVDVDGVTRVRQVAPATGLSHDGAAAVYQRVQVGAGTHRLAVRLRDNTATGGFNHVRELTLTLRPAQILVIDFDAEKGEITLS